LLFDLFIQFKKNILICKMYENSTILDEH